MNSKIKKSCVLSKCNKYRYELRRAWNSSKPQIMFILLNPSTADDIEDDPTIKKCISYTKRLKGGSIVVCNIFSYRSTDPRLMKQHNDPVGPNNDYWIKKNAKESKLIIAGWGKHGSYLGRAEEICRMLPKMHCFKINKDGSPTHFLYLPSNLKPILFRYSVKN